MNISQALKQKNKLVKRLNIVQERLLKNNRVIKGNRRTYLPTDLLADNDTLQEELIRIKTLIAVASAPIMATIITLAERKAYIKMLKLLPVSEDTEHNYRTEKSIEYDVIITEERRNNLVETTENDIEILQNELDKFNATTEI